MSTVALDKKAILDDKKMTADLWGVAINKEYMGKGYNARMMELCEKFAQKQGYSYAFCYACNHKTSRSLVKVNF